MLSMRLLMAGMAAVALFAVEAHAGEQAARAAFRRSLDQADNPAPTLRRGLQHQDWAIRRFALWKLHESGGAKRADMVAAAGDKAPEVRRLAATLLAASFADDEAALLAKLAKDDADEEVRRAAARAHWPFYRETVLLKDNPSWDYEVVSLGGETLAADGWKAMEDAERRGHRRDFFAAGLDDKNWKKAATGRAWPFAGDTVAWYRTHFTLPAKDKANALELVFDGVADSAWVWLNGEYLGQRLAAEPGAFRLDASREARWGADNVLVVRVEGKGGAGGLVGDVRYERMQ